MNLQSDCPLKDSSDRELKEMQPVTSEWESARMSLAQYKRDQIMSQIVKSSQRKHCSPQLLN